MKKKKKSNGNDRGIKNSEIIPDTSKNRTQKRRYSFHDEDNNDSDSDLESYSSEKEEYKEENNIESRSVYSSDEEVINSESNSSKGSDSNSSNEEDNRRYRLFAKQKVKRIPYMNKKSNGNDRGIKNCETIPDTSKDQSQKRGHSFHNKDNSDSNSDLESCSSEEEENSIESRSIYTSDEEKVNSESNSSKASDSDLDSSNKEDNQRYRLVAKQKVKRIPVYQIPKRNKNLESEKSTPMKVKKLVPLQKKSFMNIISCNGKNRYASDEILNATTNSVHTLLSDDISKKAHEHPPLNASNAVKCGISRSKSLQLQTLRSTTTSKMTKKKKIESKFALGTQSNKTGVAADEGESKKKKNHTKASKAKETKEPSYKIGFRSQSKTKERGIRATKSMPVHKKKATVTMMKMKKKKVVARIALDSDLSSSLSDDSEFVVETIDNISEISSLSKAEKKRGRKEEKSKSNDASTSKIPKDSYSDKIGFKKDQFGTKRRGIRPSKRTPIGKKKPKTKSSVVLWTDMVHDSESDSDDDSIFVLETTAMDDASGVSSLSTSDHARKTVTSPQEKDVFEHLKEEENRRRSSSRKTDTSKKPRELGNWYGKVGKIKFETKKDEMSSWQPSGGHRVRSKLEDILCE